MVDHDCVILCGGLGTRLRDVIGSAPKVMAEVGGRPFLDLIIEHLKRQGVTRIILCTGYQADAVENYYREHDFGLIIDFSREEEPLGTGGALKSAKEIIFSDTFFVFNGDSFLPVDLPDFLEFHQEKDALASILVSKAKEANDVGRLKIDASGQIINFQEKIGDAVGAFANAGIYCFDQEIFSCMPVEDKFSLENDFFPHMAGDRFYGYYTDKEFIDIGTPERYQLAKENLSKGNSGGNRK